MRYLLDTNVCVDYLNGRYPAVIERWQACDPRWLGIGSVAMAELRYGAEKSHRREANHRQLDRLFAELTEVVFDAEAALQYGRLRDALERRGKVIGPNDMLIAAQAHSRSLVLVTNNLDEFGRIGQLRVEDWRRPL